MEREREREGGKEKESTHTNKGQQLPFHLSCIGVLLPSLFGAFITAHISTSLICPKMENVLRKPGSDVIEWNHQMTSSKGARK